MPMNESKCFYVSSRNRHRGFVRVGLIIFGVLCCTAGTWAQNGAVGALRVRVIDQDWDVPLAGAMVHVVEAEKRMVSGEDGNVLFDTLPGGSYTLVVSAPGFERKVLSQVIVVPGDAKSEEIRLNGAFTDMEEFVVKDLEITTGATEVIQLNIRSQSSSLMDNVGSDMMSKAGASTAAAALKMVSGATIQDGKYAVIRGLGDRYTSTSINAVRLPNADRDKRAVSMDQFPSAMIESVQVSKTFMPDQQGEGTGSINIKTKGMPDKLVLQASVSTEYDSNATGNDRFKIYHNGGNDMGGMRGLTSLDFWDNRTGRYPRGGEVQPRTDAGDIITADKQYSTLIQNDTPPMNYGYKFAVGDFAELGDWKVGGMLLGSFTQKYKYRMGEQYGLNPNVMAQKVVKDDDKTQSVEDSSDEQLWSTGLTLGAKNDNNNIRFTGLYTHQSKDKVEIKRNPYTPLAVSDPIPIIGGGRPPPTIGYKTDYTRNRELNMLMQYTESANGSLQLAGDHTFSVLNDSVLDWGVSYNMAESIEPDRRQVSKGEYNYSRTDEEDLQVPPNITRGAEVSVLKNIDFERRWQDTRESGLQGQMNYKQPYQLAEGWDGWFKGGGVR